MMRETMRRKGSGELIAKVILIVIIILVGAVLVYTTITESLKRQQTAIENVALMQTKNTFYLVNKSLQQVLFVSAVQSVFQAADDAGGCGIDDKGIDEKFWLQTKGGKARTDDYEKIVNMKILPAADEKYNSPNDNPRICIPKELHLQDYLTGKAKPFETIAESFRVNGNNVVLSSFKLLLGTPNPSLASVNIEVYEGGSCKESRTCVKTTEMQKVNLPTELSNAFSAARSITEALVRISNSFIPVVSNPPGPDDVNPNYDHRLKYQDTCSDDILNIQTTPSKDSYSNSVQQLVEAIIKVNQQKLQKSFIFLAYNQYEFLVPEEDGVIQRGTGLLLHYNASIKITEAVAGSVIECRKPDDTYKGYADSAVKISWDFGNVHYEESEIAAVIYSMINAESGWYQYDVSDCGAAGLMQLMPGTAKENGISNIYEDASFTKCNKDYAGRLRFALGYAREPEMLDGRFNAEQNVQAGVKYFHRLLSAYAGRYQDNGKDVPLVLAVAAYNAGEGNVNDAIQDAQTPEWVHVREFLPDETQDYVPKVLGCILPYGGRLQFIPRTTAMAWPTESKTISPQGCYGDRSGGNNPLKPPAFHGGIDILSKDGSSGDDVYAALGGVVFKIGKCAGGGNCIAILHGTGDDAFMTWYMHLESFDAEILRRFQSGENVVVKAGQKIGTMGDSGAERAGVHLHFAIRSEEIINLEDDYSVNPCLYLDCEQSKRKCPVLPNTVKGKFAELPNIPRSTVIADESLYYHAVTDQQFISRPVSLEFRTEDYLPAIDCIKIPNVYKRNGRFEDYLFYYWDDDKKPDVICYKGCIYTCNYGQQNAPEFDGMEGTCPYTSKNRKLTTGQTPEDPPASGPFWDPNYRCGDDLSQKTPTPNTCTP